jgi:hypothetical protein
VNDELERNVEGCVQRLCYSSNYPRIVLERLKGTRKTSFRIANFWGTFESVTSRIRSMETIFIIIIEIKIILVFACLHQAFAFQ